MILGQWVPWSFPHTVPWFFKHLETSLECHTVGSSIFLEDRSRAASIMASLSSQPFRCSHSSCLPHFKTRINSSWWVLFRFKEGWKRCSNLGKWKCLSLVELFSSWFLTPNWKHAQSHTHSSVKGRRLSVHEVGWSYGAARCEHLVYSDSWPQTLVFSPASVCMSVRTHSCPTLNPVDCRPPGSSVHGLLHTRIPEWVAIFSRGSSWPRDQTCISCISSAPRGFFQMPFRCHTKVLASEWGWFTIHPSPLMGANGFSFRSVGSKSDHPSPVHCL